MHYILRAVAGVAATLPGTAASGALATPLPPLKGKGGEGWDGSGGDRYYKPPSVRPCFLYPAFAGLTVAMQYPRGRKSGTPSAHSELTFGLTPVLVPAYIRRVASVD